MTKQGSVTRRASVAMLASLASGAALSQAFPPGAAPGIKKAICVGNSRYVTRPLKNPVNDAKSVGTALRELGFDVTLLLDSTLAEMREAFRVFFEQSKDAETAFIFYAGHGFEVNGTNYLIPSDANPSTITSNDIAQLGFSMRTLTSELERSRAKVKVVVIDACRDTPKRGPTLGMQQMTAKGTLLAFSTSPGYLAEDSMVGIKTGNSPYTFALTESLRNRDLTLKEMFNRAHNTVAALTQERQIPWVHDGMTGDVRLFDSKVIVNAAAVGSSQIATNKDQGVSRGGRPPWDNQGEPPPLEVDASGKYIDAKQQIERRYGSADPRYAVWRAISRAEPVLLKLCIDAGLPISIKANGYSNSLISPIIEFNSDVVRIIEMLSKISVPLDLAGNSGDLIVNETTPNRILQITKQFDDVGPYGRGRGSGVSMLCLQALPIAIWYKNIAAAQALVSAGLSLDSPVSVYSNPFNALNALGARIQISTCRLEMQAMGIRI